MIVLSLTCLIGVAQTSQYSGTGDWSEAGKWNNGIPDSSINASIAIGGNPTVSGTWSCNNLSLFLSSLTIASGGQLTIHGEYSATTSGANQNNGTLILKGTLKPTIGGGVVITTGNGGGLTLQCGLTLSNFSIDRTE